MRTESSAVKLHLLKDGRDDRPTNVPTGWSKLLSFLLTDFSCRDLRKSLSLVRQTES